MRIAREWGRRRIAFRLGQGRLLHSGKMRAGASKKIGDGPKFWRGRTRKNTYFSIIAAMAQRRAIGSIFVINMPLPLVTCEHRLPR
jgi:hypothetical protein